MAFPAANYLSDAARTNAEMKIALEAFLAECKLLPGASVAVAVTLNADTFVPTGATCILTPQSGASDNLVRVSVNGIRDGGYLLLSPASGKTITVQSNAGGSGEMLLSNATSCVLSAVTDHILLRRSGTQWIEVFRNVVVTPTHGIQKFIGDGNFTVPAGVTTIYVTCIGGLGGGGGGGGSDSVSGGQGGTGGTGGTTTFGALFSCTGGLGGGGGCNKTLGTVGGIARGGAGAALYGQHGGNAWSDVEGRGANSSPSWVAGISAGPGKGGDGAAHATYPGSGGGSGSRPNLPVIREAATVTPGQVIAVTIGAGGAGGAGGLGGGNAGSQGADGVVLVEW